MRAWIPLAGLVLLALAGCVADEPRRMRVFDEPTFARVRIGMAPEQVLPIAGTPTRVVRSAPVTWYYAAGLPPRSPIQVDEPAGRRLGAVFFDRRQRVDRVILYVRVDGVIVDAVSRMPADGVTARA